MTHSSHRGRAELGLLAVLAVPVAAALATHGGYFARGQIAFAVLCAGVTLGVVAIAGMPRREWREPALLALAGLAALSAAGALWTVAAPGDAVRWAAVIAAYALLAVAASRASARLGPEPIAATIVVLVAVAGIVGLYGAGARVEPLAQRLGGQWSPGGPLEYSPALALAQLSALPFLLVTMVRASSERVAGLAALGAAIAGAVLALAGSRVELALGLAVVAATVPVARRVLGLEPRRLLAAAALAVSAGGFADAIAGGYTQPYVTGGDAPRLAGLGAVVLGAGVLWIAQRRTLEGARAGGRPSALAVACVLLPLLGGLGAAWATPDSGPQAEPVSGFAHGRVALWRAAVDVGLDRPVLGAGSQGFFDASVADQDPPPVRFAHNLPLESFAELGVAGFALALLLYGGCAALAWSRRNEVAGLFLGPAVLAFLAANLFDWPWHVPASGGIFALALGGLIGAPRALRRAG